MRENIQTIMLVGESLSSIAEFCWALRYSTHCLYKIVSEKEPFQISNYEFFSWYTPEQNRVNVDERVDYIINFNDTNFSFQENFLSPTDIKQLKKKINKSLLSSDLSKFFTNKDENFLLDFYIDFEGEITMIGCVSLNKDEDIFKVFDSRELIKIRGFLIDVLESVLRPLQNTFFTFCISENNFNKVDIVNVNTVSKHWNIYRSLGINIPLIIIQNLMKRKIQTLKMVDYSHIRKNQDSQIVYTFKFNHVYVDLDQTLVWNWKPMTEVIDLTKKLKQSGKKIHLLTRHELDVSETLKLIGINENFFDSIKVVLPHEKKSQFIDKHDSFFIDNEFPQRLDVRKNNVIPVLDVDQIEFLKECISELNEN